MRVHIVCYEDVNAWILGKFALKLKEELNALSIESDISKYPDPTADINHHIIYGGYDGKKNSIDTLMITHIDSITKIHILKQQLKSAELGICMSSHTMKELIDAGLPREKLCYINPAHDSVLQPRKIIIGITSKVHDDGRKNENMLLKIIRYISPKEFMFKIMGKGWEDIVDNMRNNGFEVEYYNEFNYNIYINLVPTFDYYLYFSFDEGSMGFVDALAAGVPTIVTPQGYHLDAIGGITYPINNLEDILKVFNQISDNKKKLIRSVETWTWENYARKHVELWEYLLNDMNNKYIYNNINKYPDGLRSLQIKQTHNLDFKKKIQIRYKLIAKSFKYFIHNPLLICYAILNRFSKFIQSFMKK